MLRYRADIRTLGFVLTFFVGLAVLWQGGLAWWIALPVHLTVILMAIIGAVINHNALHSPVFRSRSLNRAFQVALTFMYGVPVSLFVPVHNLSHHRHMQTAKDVTRSHKLRSRFNLLNLLWCPSRIARDTLADDLRYFRAQRKKGRAIWKQFRRELVFLALFDLSLVLLDWQNFLLYVFLPQQAAQAFIVMINFVQHDGCDDDPKSRNCVRNFVGPLFNWLLLNNGFHTIHHLKPGLHWSLTPAAHAREVAPRIHPALDVTNGFAFIWRYAIWPGRRQDYEGRPYLPPPNPPDEYWAYETREVHDPTPSAASG